jgi:hypothetical protein
MKVHPDLLIYRYKTLITVTFLVSAYLTIHHLRDFDNWFRGRQGFWEAMCCHGRDETQFKHRLVVLGGWLRAAALL